MLLANLLFFLSAVIAGTVFRIPAALAINIVAALAITGTNYSLSSGAIISAITMSSVAIQLGYLAGTATKIGVEPQNLRN